MIVVPDTSPILNLARIERLDLLPKLYSKVLIPTAVNQELAAALATFPLPNASAAGSWLSVREPADRKRITKLSLQLDPGESEAIVLAGELGAHLLLMDERKGRRIASSAGLSTIGLAGILLQAKRSGHVPSVKPLLDALVNEARFWLGPQLYRRILDELGE